MRTDSTTLSDTAIAAARSIISERYGRDFLPDAPRHYASKVKNAQEAHEAIRPAGDTFRSPEQVARELPTHRGAGLRADLAAHRRIADDRRRRRDRRRPRRRRHAGTAVDAAEFSATGTIITHAGFRRAYVEDVDDEADRDERRAAPARRGAGRRTRCRRARARRPRDPAAAALHRGVAGQAARGARRRPPLDVRVDHGHHPGPRLRVEEGLGTRADVHRLQRRDAARGALPQPGRLRLHRSHGGRPRRDRQRRPRGRALVEPLLLRCLTDVPRPQRDGQRPTSARSMRGRSTRSHSASPPTASRSSPASGKNGPYLQCGEKSRSIRDDMAPDELTLEKAIELLDTPRRSVVGIDPETGPRCPGPQRPLRSVRATRSRRSRQQGEAEERVAAVSR